MGQHGARAREALLDAAEELFARDGIDAVSNRRIAEHVGSANHSAVAYHFGTRDDLIQALLTRHSAQLQSFRDAQVRPDLSHASLRDILFYRIEPLTEMLAHLPVPSWRARFLAQSRTVPSVAEFLIASARAESTDELAGRTRELLGDAHPAVMRARMQILGHMISGLCAEYEEQIESGDQPERWRQVGNFLADASAGMLAAPVTTPTPDLPAPTLPPVV